MTERVQLRDDLPANLDPHFALVPVSEGHAGGLRTVDVRGEPGWASRSNWLPVWNREGPSVAHATVPTRTDACKTDSEMAVEVSQDSEAVPTIAGETGESSRGCGISDKRTSRSGHAVASSASRGVCVEMCTRSSTATLPAQDEIGPTPRLYTKDAGPTDRSGAYISETAGEGRNKGLHQVILAATQEAYG